MQQLVSITSQGQISIPAEIRRNLKLDKYKKALVKQEGERVIVEPVSDFMALEGSLHHKAIKGKSIDEIIKLEEEAIGKAIGERYKRKMKDKIR